MSQFSVNKYSVSPEALQSVKVAFKDVPIDFSRLGYCMKLVKSGSMVEVMEYDVPPYAGSTRTKKRVDPNNVFDQSYIEKRYMKLKTEITRLVEANHFNRHITVTYRTSQTKVDVGYKDLKAFIRKLGLFLKEDFEYIAIMEFQRDTDYFGKKKPEGGSVHYHILINCGYIDVLQLNTLWGRGGVNIEYIYNKRTISRYFSKYVSKDLCDVRFYRKKKYSTSRNLQRPQVYYNEDAQEVLSSCVGLSLSYTKNIASSFLGNIRYSVYFEDQITPADENKFQTAVDEMNKYFNSTNSELPAGSSP